GPAGQRGSAARRRRVLRTRRQRDERGEVDRVARDRVRRAPPLAGELREIALDRRRRGAHRPYSASRDSAAAAVSAMRSRNAVPMPERNRSGSGEPSTIRPKAFGSTPLRNGSSAIDWVAAPPSGSQVAAWKSEFGPQNGCFMLLASVIASTATGCAHSSPR